jgi:hypothetical protein
MDRLFPLVLVLFMLSGCIGSTATVSLTSNGGQQSNSDKLLLSGLREVCENRPPVSLESLLASHPHSRQADLASELLTWRQGHPQQSILENRKSVETELRELREENRRLRSDLEQLRQLLIETERRSR